jgi:hypothetical protein
MYQFEEGGLSQKRTHFRENFLGNENFRQNFRENGNFRETKFRENWLIFASFSLFAKMETPFSFQP